MTTRPLRLLAAACLLCLQGCFWKPAEIVPFPDAPLLIAESRGEYVRAFIYKRETRELVELGWVRLEGYEGWTLTKYDWEARVIKDGESDASP